jgi:hypothetical protein
MLPNGPYFIILLCLTPIDFICQGEAEWVNQTIAICTYVKETH